LVENKVVDISKSGTQYAFVTDNTPAPVKRFKIVTNSIKMVPVVSTHKIETNPAEMVPVASTQMIVTNPIELIPVASTQLKVFNSGNTVFIQNSGDLNGEMIVYDMMGRAIKRATFSPYGVTAVQLETISGAYIIKAATSNEIERKKIVF